MALRKDLVAIIDALLAESDATKELSLDAVGEALGVRVVSAAEIDAVMGELEARGRTLVTPAGGAGEDRLRAVVAAARQLKSTSGGNPTAVEIAERAGLSVGDVRHALTLLAIMQR